MIKIGRKRPKDLYDIKATLNLPQNPANKGAPARDKRKIVKQIAINEESL